MAENQQRIDDLVDLQAVETQLKTTQQLSAGLTKQFVDNLKAANDLNAALGRVGNNSQFKKAASEAEASAQKVTAAQNRIAKAEAERIRLEEKRQRIVRESTADDLARARASQQETAAIQQNTQALAANEATMRRNNIAEIQGEQAAARHRNARLQSTVATAEETAAVTANTAAQAANAGSLANVGRSLTKGLGYLRTLAYVLPGIGIAGIFNVIIDGVTALYSAIFTGREKLDMFVAKLQNMNEVLKSTEFKTTVSNIIELRENFKLAESGVISKDGVLKQYNETLGKTTGYADDFNEAEKITLERGDKVLQLMILKTAAQGLLAKAAEKASERALELNKTELEVATFGDRVKGGLNFELPGLFESAEKVRQREAKKTLEEQKKLGAARRTQNAADLKKEEEQFIKGFERLQKEAADFAKKNKLNFFQDSGKPDDPKGEKSNTFSQYLQQQKKILESNLQNEQASYDDRLTAIAAFEGASLMLIKQGVKAKEFTQEEANTKSLEVTNESAKDRVKIENDAQKKLLELFKEGEKIQKEIAENSLSVYKQYGLQRLQQIEDDKNAAIDGLTDQLEQGKISLKEYESIRADIEQQANIDSAQQTVNNYKLLIEKLQEYGENVDSEEKQLFDAEVKLDNLKRDIKIKNLEMVANKRKELNDKIKELEFDLAKSLIDLGQTLANISVENQKNRLQGESDAIDERKNREISEVDRSLATEQQKADKVTLINAKAQAEQESIAKQQRKLDAERAKTQKLFSLANIAINAAEKIAQVQTIGAVLLANPLTAPLAPLAFAQIPFILGISAAQAAAVLATPIPAYAKGTKNAKGGLSIVGEQGRERIDTPDGRSFLSPDTATMLNLPAGSKVTPHHETMRMIGRPENLSRYSGGEQVPWREVIVAIKDSKKQNTKVVNRIEIDGSFYAYRNNHFR